MKKALFSILILFYFLPGQAQQAARAMFFEIGGPGIASFNYDHRFFRKEAGLGGRIGAGGFSFSFDGVREGIFFFPAGANYLFGRDGKNYFELGAGFTLVALSSSRADGNNDFFEANFGHLNFGYRLQPAEGGFFFRAAVNPVFGYGIFWPYYGGVSFGYKF